MRGAAASGSSDGPAPNSGFVYLFSLTFSSFEPFLPLPLGSVDSSGSCKVSSMTSSTVSAFPAVLGSTVSGSSLSTVVIFIFFLPVLSSSSTMSSSRGWGSPSCSGSTTPLPLPLLSLPSFGPPFLSSVLPLASSWVAFHFCFSFSISDSSASSRTPSSLGIATSSVAVLTGGASLSMSGGISFVGSIILIEASSFLAPSSSVSRTSSS
mmetsp:Transcript_37477/g.112394  ORF Transcript_37477/g.112394 Transcript_37477/m.112394 type:complete len:209 (-) Transcript_37477:184-810(-)